MPILAAAMMGSVDIALAAAMKLEFEKAAQRATELAMVKRPEDSDGTAFIEAEAAAATAGRTVTGIHVELYTECQALGETPTGPVDYAVRRATVERTACYVSATVTGTDTPMFNFSGLFGDGSGTMTISGSNSVQLT
jgi:Flp pilus assembly protein TadG